MEVIYQIMISFFCTRSLNTIRDKSLAILIFFLISNHDPTFRHNPHYYS